MARDDDDDDIEDEEEKDTVLKVKKNDVVVILGALFIGIVIGYMVKRLLDNKTPPDVMYAPPWMHGKCSSCQQGTQNQKPVDDLSKAASYIEQNIPTYKREMFTPLDEGGMVDKSTGDLYFSDPTVYESYMFKRDPKTGRILGMYKINSEYGYDVV